MAGHGLNTLAVALVIRLFWPIDYIHTYMSTSISMRVCLFVCMSWRSPVISQLSNKNHILVKFLWHILALCNSLVLVAFLLLLYLYVCMYCCIL